MGQDFQSPTFGKLSVQQVREKVLSFIEAYPSFKYRLVIGTDSQPKNGNGTDFVTVVIIYRIGMGGIYFWQRTSETRQSSLHSRMYQEASYSLSCAQQMLEVFKDDGITKYDVEIHVDIGEHGPTKELITEIVGMIKGTGFAVKIKPYSFGASKVADRHT